MATIDMASSITRQRSDNELAVASGGRDVRLRPEPELLGRHQGGVSRNT